MDSIKLQALLSPFGLHTRGRLELSQNDLAEFELADFSESPCCLTLVGNIGSSFWPVFRTSEEFNDSRPDPLDRWSRRIAERLAKEMEAIALYPFDGPPYLPFQQWAQRAENLSQSPPGLMIHAQFGLWHAYRFALLSPQNIEDSRKPAQVTEPSTNHITTKPNAAVNEKSTRVESPCLSCRDQPCLNTCPVGAFSLKGYDVNTCAQYLKQDPTVDCHALGCIARLACPVAVDFRYRPEQNAFHLKAFVSSR